MYSSDFGTAFTIVFTFILFINIQFVLFDAYIER